MRRKPRRVSRSGNPSRREFLKTSAVLSASALVGGCASLGARPAPGILHREQHEERLRVGLIGCGDRGTGAAQDCVNAAANIQIVALGDLFPDRLEACKQKLCELGPAYQVFDEHCFVGFEAYKGVLACDVDIVILATPPHFRPLHLQAAVEAGKHVFMEKPVAVDPAGVRSVIASSQQAARKGLSIVAGTQRRHDPRYIETVKRIHDGAIGEIVAAQCYWNQGGLWIKERQPEWSEMECQCRNWLYYTWLSGDHIVEQHVHNLDVINWVLRSPPLKAVGMGGRQSRTDPQYGNVYDHFSVEYEYPRGVRVLSMCRQVEGASTRIGERVIGTWGWANPNGETHGRILPWKYKSRGTPVNPYVQEHADLIASIRRGRPINEGRQVAESTLTAIMGRMSAYTGREISWDWVLNASQLDLTPPAYEFGDLPIDPVPVPGITKLV